MIVKTAVVSVLMLMVVVCGSEELLKSGYMTDSRDGKKYKTVKIGLQTWMAENLNYKTANSWCYGDSKSNCDKYGLLYTWKDAMEACPIGWHLPNDKDWAFLFHAVGRWYDGTSSWVAGGELKSQVEWYGSYGSCGGKDSFGFSAMPAGWRFDYGEGNHGYRDAGSYANFWSSSEFSGTSARYIGLSCYSNQARYSWDRQKFGFSVRCLKGEPPPKDTVRLAGLLGGSDGGVKPRQGYVRTQSEHDIEVACEDEYCSRSAADIMKIVYQRMPGLRGIYNWFLRNTSGFQGKVTLKFTIVPGGQIINISIVSSTTGFVEFDDEIKTAVCRWKFSKVKSGNTTVTIPFEFYES